MSFPKWPIVAIDGAAGGGKSSLVDLAIRKLSTPQRHIYRTNEPATLLDRCHALFKEAIKTDDAKRRYPYESEILRTTRLFENALLRFMTIDACPQAVLLSECGCQNNRAFFPEGAPGEPLFRKALKRAGLHPLEALDRYAGVIDMVNPADGAERYYVKKTGKTPEVARHLERRTQEAWLGHEHLWIIPNFTTVFKKKLERGLEALHRILGIPEPREIERKFLLAGVPDLANLPVAHRVVNMEQTYLRKHNGARPRVRRRFLPEDPGYSTFYHGPVAE